MQLENELTKLKGTAVLKDRYYDGIIRGSKILYKDEGIRGLYKGQVQ